MKRLLFVFVSFWSLTILYGQNKVENSLYIYRNDGDFNAFHSSDIDSITYTLLEDYDVDVSNCIVQNIWTKDSLYKIPVSSIDSVSFVPPQNILRANAICIDSLLMPYVEAYDTITLYVSSTIRPELLPKVGDVLYSFSYKEPLPEGYLGKVKTITNELGNYKIECEIAGLPDIYEKYTFFYSGSISTNATDNNARTRAQNDEIADFHFSIPINEIGGNLDCTLAYLDNVTTIEYYDERKQITKHTHKQSISITLSANGEINGAYCPSRLLWEAPRPLYIPIPSTPLGVYIQPGFGLNLSGKIGAGVTFSFSNTTEEIQIRGEENQTNDSGWHADVAFDHLSLSGEFFPYFNIAVSVGLPLQIVSGGIDVRLGVDLKGEIDINLPAGSSYDAYKDSKVSAEYVASVHPLVTILGHRWERFDLAVDRRYNHHTNDGYDMRRFNFWERFLFPEFNSIWVDIDEKKNATISLNVMREILFPETVGIGLYDNNSNLIGASYAPIRYNDPGFQNPMEFEFPLLEPGMTYVARPIISWLGGTMVASPEEVFSIDANVETLGKDDITIDAATCYGYAEIPQGNGLKVDYGICYDDEIIPVVGQSPKLSANTPGNFSVRLTGLKEKTTYWYRAYLDIDGNVYYGETDFFTTMSKENSTSTAYVGEATAEEETAQFEYGFNNVPEGGTCHIALQQDGGETYYYFVPAVEKDIFQLYGLQPSTTYNYWAYIDYYGDTWKSNMGSFTTKTPLSIPIATTGDYSNVTMNSATVSCTYENAPDDGVCGVEYTWDGGTNTQTVGNSNGTHSITLSDLQQGTTYTYRAYIDVKGTIYYGEYISFNTEEKIPDVVGTWICTENRITDGTFFESSKIILTADGKAYYEFIEGSAWFKTGEGHWNASGDGNIGISVSYDNGPSPYGTTYWTKTIDGIVDNIDAPSTIEGIAYRDRWHTSGGSGAYSCTIIMNKQ